MPTDPCLDYALVDVFAERPLEGNQLAIFTNARGLSTGQMQALARETNLAETTFILPPENEADIEFHGMPVRIFTTQEELPFAGHPTLGTSAWLHLPHPHLRGRPQITLRLQAGNITVRFDPPTPDQPGVFGTMQQLDPVFGAIHSRHDAAHALGLSLDDLDPNLPIQNVSTGMPFCIVPLRSMQAIARLAVPQSIAQPYLDRTGAKFFYCTTPAPAAAGSDFHSRMQFYNGEDPATGSASGCAIAYLVHHGIVPSARPTVFEQGLEIRRPSRIHAQATLSAGKVHSVFVGGRTIAVAAGRFFQHP